MPDTTVVYEPVQTVQSAYLLDELILSAREDGRGATPSGPLPSAHELLRPCGMPMAWLPTWADLVLPALPEAPGSPPDSEQYDADEEPASPNLAHSRLARRWFKGIVSKGAETPSLLDLTELCNGVDDDQLVPSPTSVVEF